MESVISTSTNFGEVPYSDEMAAALRARRQIFHINETAVLLLSVPANLTLILLLLTERNDVLRAYTNVLLQNCAVDIAYTLVVYVTQPVEWMIYARDVTEMNYKFFRKLETNDRIGGGGKIAGN